jgi:hypothetical protein
MEEQKGKKSPVLTKKLYYEQMKKRPAVAAIHPDPETKVHEEKRGKIPKEVNNHGRCD